MRYVGRGENLDFNCFAQFFQLNLHTGCQNRNTWRFAGIAGKSATVQGGNLKAPSDNKKALKDTKKFNKNLNMLAAGI